jgi:hypothetical protein
MTGRELYAALHLLDRQLLDRDGGLCGKVDDLELTEAPDGQWYVSAVLSGPGALWYRLKRRRLGRWLRSRIGDVFGDEPDPDRIPVRLVSDIGPSIRLSVDRHALASSATEHWVRDHVIAHIPGSRHDADK